MNSFGQGLNGAMKTSSDALRTFVHDLSPAAILAAILVALLAVLIYDFFLQLLLNNFTLGRSHAEGGFFTGSLGKYARGAFETLDMLVKEHLLDARYEFLSNYHPKSRTKN